MRRLSRVFFGAALGAFFGLLPAVTSAQTSFQGVGGPLPNAVVGATRVAGGAIYAVGGFNATATLWVRDGAAFVANPLTFNFVPGGTLEQPMAITTDGAFIASRARGPFGPPGGSQAAVRVATNPLANLNLAASNLYLNPGPLFAGSTLANAISDDGTILYGVVNFPGGNRAARFVVDPGTGTVSGTLIPLPALAGLTFTFSRNTSSDGSVLTGIAGIGSTSTRAFRYDHATGISSLIPLLDGGIFNAPGALSPDGNLVLAFGTSSQTATNEAFLYNATTGIVDVLGSPNTTWLTIGGGMTPDGSVVAVSARLVSDITTLQAFFHNSHGWFYLLSALARGGVDVPAADWKNLHINGMSSDGTLVFGQGVHNGILEGFVAEFAPNYLRDFDAPAVAPVNTSIVGAWQVPADPISPGDSGVAVFNADGTFFFTESKPGDTSVPGGFERGTYTWDAVTGTFVVTTRLSTKGNFGLTEVNGFLGMTAQVSGDSLTITNSGGPTTLTRITGAPTSLAGGWVTGNPAVPDSSSVLVVLPDGTYYFAQDGDSSPTGDPTGHDGMEKGTLWWDPVSGMVTATTLVDTNGHWGLSHSLGNVLVHVSADGLTATARDTGKVGETTLARIVDPNAVKPVISSGLLAAGTLGSPFTYTLTTAPWPAGWPGLTLGATGLPAGLTFDAGTGTVSGTPAQAGTFHVALSASNTLNDGPRTSTATLDLVIASNITRTGFYSPVSSGLNIVKGGSTVPLKFNVYAGGVEQTDTAGLQFSLASLPCAGGPETPVPFETTGGTTLRYSGHAFMQNWKTPATPGVCYLVRMTTVADGQSLSALFRMK